MKELVKLIEIGICAYTSRIGSVSRSLCFKGSGWSFWFGQPLYTSLIPRWTARRHLTHIDAKVLDQSATDDPTVVNTDAEVLDKPAANDQESVPELKVIRHLYNVNSKPEIDEVEKIMFSASAIKRKLARFTLSSFFKKQIISIALNYFPVEFICSV